MATDTAVDNNQDTELKRHVGVVGLLFASVGSIIGSGWLFGALDASVAAGPAAIISWALGGLMILLIALTYAELGTMFPLSGGVVRFPHLAFGHLRELHLGLDHLGRGGHHGADRGRGGAAVRHEVRRLHHRAHGQRRRRSTR